MIEDEEEGLTTTERGRTQVESRRKKEKRRKKFENPSLLPKPVEATHIQVQNYLPVTVFRLSVPKLPRLELSLPRLDPNTNTSL